MVETQVSQHMNNRVNVVLMWSASWEELYGLWSSLIVLVSSGYSRTAKHFVRINKYTYEQLYAMHTPILK